MLEMKETVAYARRDLNKRKEYRAKRERQRGRKAASEREAYQG